MLSQPSEEALTETGDARKEYDRVILEVFRLVQKAEANVLPFAIQDIERAANKLGVVKGNKYDIAYTYRSGRSALPAEILQHGNWVIEAAGRGKYRFVRLARSPYFDLPEDMERTRILDATPAVLLKYQGGDEQAMLARIRYNRLVDTFMGLTAYQLQGHFRTTLPKVGQIEVDDLYLGVNEDGAWYALPVEGKVGAERLGVIQIRSLAMFARHRFPRLARRPLGVKLLSDGTLLFVEFNDEIELDAIAPRRYKRYQLVRED